jgi:hypothetical protein
MTNPPSLICNWVMHLMLTNCCAITRLGAIGDEWFHNLSEVKCLDSKFQIDFTSSKPKKSGSSFTMASDRMTCRHQSTAA